MRFGTLLDRFVVFYDSCGYYCFVDYQTKIALTYSDSDIITDNNTEKEFFKMEENNIDNMTMEDWYDEKAWTIFQGMQDWFLNHNPGEPLAIESLNIQEWQNMEQRDKISIARKISANFDQYKEKFEKENEGNVCFQIAEKAKGSTPATYEKTAIIKEENIITKIVRLLRSVFLKK